jgi:hypothetical protein
LPLPAVFPKGSRRSAADIEAVVLTHDATTALTGHGPPWKGSLGEAVERARAAGAA